MAAITRANLSGQGQGGGQASAKPALPQDPQQEVRQTAFGTKVEDAVVEAFRQTNANIQPNIGTGKANVNTNRRLPNGEGGWTLGNNPEGVSDRNTSFE